MPTVRVSYSQTIFALTAFMLAFFGARAFTTAYPDTVVIDGGIHFHHFWYGLGMVVASGWLGIVSFHRSLNRLYATVFGFGGGLIGDEVGLLLTFGNYQSELTYFFFVGFVCLVVLLVLLSRYGKELKGDLEGMSRGEGVVHVGLVLAGLSALPFSIGLSGYGFGVLAVGGAVALGGFWFHRRSMGFMSSSSPTPAD